MDATIVELRGVRKSFGDFMALRGIDLTVRKGEFITLLGPSGCGKTTTLRIIGGFERPDEGEILLESREVSNVPPNARDVNTVFQSYALFPHLTVWDNVAFGLRMRKTPKEELRTRVSEALDLVQLTSLGNRKPSEMSGGQQQRVALARALVNKPKVLLLDEPLASLDLQLRRRMQVELKHLQQQVGITFVFVTHDQEEALTVSDRIAVMNGGVIEQLGTPAEVYNDPATRFVSQFIGETNLIEGEVGSLRSDGHTTVETPFGTLRVAEERVRTGMGSGAGTRATLSVRPERLKPLGPTVGQPGEPRECRKGILRHTRRALPRCPAPRGGGQGAADRRWLVCPGFRPG